MTFFIPIEEYERLSQNHFTCTHMETLCIPCRWFRKEKSRRKPGGEERGGRQGGLFCKKREEGA